MDRERREKTNKAEKEKAERKKKRVLRRCDCLRFFVILNVCLKSFQKYSKKPSSQLEPGSLALSDATGGKKTTQTHLYKFGTKVPTASLLDTAQMSEFACGLTSFTNIAATPSPKLEFYNELKQEVTMMKDSIQNMESSITQILQYVRSVGQSGSSSNPSNKEDMPPRDNGTN
ncbi:Uncharacterized protein TCM_044267 [Theobroma cacao]|uniref:Uncharacterized protein n=1 Tax=Theobroma cacao TaxID=3641 RepID=A0A061FWU0_THECC|nr:Uncharacterized protein TCM_044267 [Theobroma cacao]